MPNRSSAALVLLSNNREKHLWELSQNLKNLPRKNEFDLLVFANPPGNGLRFLSMHSPQVTVFPVQFDSQLAHLVALYKAFETYDKVLFVEEDVVLSHDALHLVLEYFANKPSDSWLSKDITDCVALSLFRQNYKNTSKDTLLKVSNIEFFAVALTRHNWENYLLPHYFSKLPERRWHHSLHMALVENQRYALTPALPRCNHTGRLGAHITPKQYDQTHAKTVWYKEKKILPKYKIRNSISTS